MNYSGIAAVDELDALNSKDDFEPAVDIDTAALDATIDAITAARTLLASLEALHGHLTGGGDTDTTVGLTIEVHTGAEHLDALLVDVVVDGTYAPKKGVVL
jgi:hypothetical protein